MPRDPPNTIATLPVSLRFSLILASIIDRSVHNGPRERADGRFKGSAGFQAFDDKPCLSAKRCGVDATTSRELDTLHRHLDERSCRRTVQGPIYLTRGLAFFQAFHQSAVERGSDFGAKRRDVGICRAEFADGADPHAPKRANIVSVADE